MESYHPQAFISIDKNAERTVKLHNIADPSRLGYDSTKGVEYKIFSTSTPGLLSMEFEPTPDFKGERVIDLSYEGLRLGGTPLMVRRRLPAVEHDAENSMINLSQVGESQCIQLSAEHPVQYDLYSDASDASAFHLSYRNVSGRDNKLSLSYDGQALQQIQLKASETTITIKSSDPVEVIEDGVKPDTPAEGEVSGDDQPPASLEKVEDKETAVSPEEEVKETADSPEKVEDKETANSPEEEVKETANSPEEEEMEETPATSIDGETIAKNAPEEQEKGLANSDINASASDPVLCANCSQICAPAEENTNTTVEETAPVVEKTAPVEKPANTEEETVPVVGKTVSDTIQADVTTQEMLLLSQLREKDVGSFSHPKLGKLVFMNTPKKTEQEKPDELSETVPQLLSFGKEDVGKVVHPQFGKLVYVHEANDDKDDEEVEKYPDTSVKSFKKLGKLVYSNYKKESVAPKSINVMTI